MEKTDRQILGLLAEDGRMSYTDLGKATGLSTSAVHQRVKRLEERGLILGYGATIDHAAAGKPLTAFVSITPFDVSEKDDYPDRLQHIEEIESCWSVAGEESYILKVRVATPADLEELLARVRGGGQRLHADHDRALDAVREPPDALRFCTGARPRWQALPLSGLHRFEAFLPTFRLLFI